MIIFQVIVFAVFYASLIAIIIFMYCKYRKECQEMERDEGSESNYRMVTRLID